MPNDLYLIRLIHQQTRRPFPGERLWTAQQLNNAVTLRFLRARNCEGCDVYLQPYAGNQNAGYVLVDLDRNDPGVVDLMRANEHDPCVVLETSPGHRQAWIRLSTAPLEPALATAAGKHVARLYGGDPASTDWRHLGRLAGFTNQKSTRRTPDGYAPWVKLLYARAVLAPGADALLQSLTQIAQPTMHVPLLTASPTGKSDISAAAATAVYQHCMQRWHILERFPRPDWSIVDLWVARDLLTQGMPWPQVETVLRIASPGFPRRHGDPQEYLRRTLTRAAFPSPHRTVCHDRTPAAVAPASACSNSAGGQ